MSGRKRTRTGILGPPDRADLDRRRRRRGGVLSPESYGQLTHLLVVQALVDFGERPTLEQLRQVAARLPSDDLPMTWRLALRRYAITHAGAYFRRFARSAEWRFVGAEVIAGDASVDLIWVGPSGRVEFDELKTGIGQPARARRETLAQARRQLDTGRLLFGPRFAGVRVVVIAAPAESYFLAADGCLSDLEGAGT